MRSVLGVIRPRIQSAVRRGAWARWGGRILALGALLTLTACAPHAAPLAAGGFAPNAPRVIVASGPAELSWRPYFEDLSRGAILVDLERRRLHFWGPSGATYRAFPVAVAEAPELERTGRTQVIRKRENPDWRPTPSMMARNPDLPRYAPPGPDNPMGERALYLGWRYYAIHGTNDPRSIGRRATSGCIRLFPEHIAWLFERVEPGTPVLVVESLERASRAGQGGG